MREVRARDTLLTGQSGQQGRCGSLPRSFSSPWADCGSQGQAVTRVEGTGKLTGLGWCASMEADRPGPARPIQPDVSRMSGEPSCVPADWQLLERLHDLEPGGA